MKPILIIILSLMIIVAHGQNVDDLKQRVLKLEQNQEEIHINLQTFQKKHSIGTLFLIGGVVTTAASFLVYDQKQKDQITEDGKVEAMPILFGIGGGMIVAGTVLQIDAHKWIGRAGKYRRKK